MSDSDSVPAPPSASGRDLFRHLLRIVNDPTAIGAFTARIVEAGDLTELEISFGGGRIENVRTPGDPALLPRVIGGGRKSVEKRMNGKPNEVKEDAAALHALLVSENVLPASEIDESLVRLVSRCLLPLVASDAPEAEWRDEAASCDEPLGLEFDPCFRAMFENGWRRGALASLTPEPSSVLVAATGDWRGLPGPSGETCEAVFRLVDGVRTVEDVVRASGRDEAEVRYAIARLEHAGYLRESGSEDLLAAAQKARRDGRLDIALRYYQKAEESGGSAEAALESGRIYEIMGRADEAKAAFARYADRCESGGKVEEALRYFQSAAAANPSDSGLRRRLASLRARAGQAEAAVAEWRSLLEEGEKSGDFASVVECSRAILEHGGARNDAAFYDRFLEALRREPDSRRAAADLRALKRRFLEERDPERALRAMEALRDSGEARPDERLDHANILISSGRTQEASAELEIVTAALRDRAPEPFTPDWDLLTGVYEMLVGFDPKHLEGRLFLARDAAQSGRREKAVEHYEAYLDALGDDADPALFEAARAEVLAIDPANARAVFARADALSRQGDLGAALELLASHADAAVTGGNAEAARKLFERMLRLDPMHAGANAALAEAHALRGDRDAASASRRRLAHGHVRERRFDEAERCLRDLVAQDPLDPAPALDLALFLDARQERERAIAVLAECGEAMLRGRNFGLAERIARQLLSLDPQCAAARKIESSLKDEAGETAKAAERPAARRESAPPPPPAVPAKRAAAPAPPAAVEAEVKPAAKTGARHAPPVAPARSMSNPAPKTHTRTEMPDPADEMQFVVPEDSPEGDPFSQPPSTVSAESFGKILSSLKSMKSGGVEDDEDSADGDPASEAAAAAESHDESAAIAAPESAAAAAAPARPAVQPTTPVPPEGDVEFSSILQSLKNLKLR